MGIFGKIKDALFDTAEIEVPVKEERTHKSLKDLESELDEEDTRKDFKEHNREVEDVEKDLYKADSTFSFPIAFDEEIEETRVNKNNNPSFFDFDRKKKEKKPEYPKYEAKTKTEPFRPSPIISPVYGIIETKYQTELDEKKKVKEPKKQLDYDEVRSKAFITTVVEETVVKPDPEKFYNTEEMKVTRSFDEDILDEIEEPTIPKDLSATEALRTFDELTDIEEELTDIVNEPVKEEHDDDTLETDLFNLIDSMYEKRGEDEE